MGEHEAVSQFWKDAVERVAWTFVEAFTAALIAVGVFDLPALKAAGVAGLTAVLSVVKTLAAKQIGDKDSAAIG